MITSAGQVQLPRIPPPSPYRPDNPPDTLADQNDIQAWRNLYMARRAWALQVAERCVTIDRQIREHNERTNIINRAVGVALENLKSHVTNLQNRFQEAQNWADELVQEQKSALEGWQSAWNNLRTIPARKDIAFLGRPPTPKKGSRDRETGSLQDYLDGAEVQRAASQALGVSQDFARRVNDIKSAVNGIASDTQVLLDQARPSSLENSESLLEEVETLAKKMGSDYEHILGLPRNQKSLASISRMALGHTRDLLPSLRDCSIELQSGLEQAVQRRNSAMEGAARTMRRVSSLESRLANTQTQIVNLDVDGDAFDILHDVFQLPIVYGSVLIEAVRRREWNDKLKTDSANLAEEIAILRDEEQRRRRKWLRSIGHLVSLADDATPGLEINLQGQGPEWPEVTRKDIESYLETLKSRGMTEEVDHLSQIYADLDNPTRQQRRRTKAFKQGSVIDMGRSSLLLRGDDMVRSLKEEKAKLEEKLKGSESRIRKLEDLLHRQSHITRPLSGNFGSDMPTSPASPHPDPLSRRSSVSSRRMSANHTADEKALVQRIVALEAELNAERETVQRLQREADVERRSTTDRMQEAQSTKEDLIKNLESRQREFEEERRYLESEAKQLRHRIEELEEELFRVQDQHDHEKQEAEERLQKLAMQLEDARSQAADELEAVRSEAAGLQADYTAEKKRADNLSAELAAQQDKITSQEETISQLRKQLEDMEKEKQENLGTLQAAHSSLSPGGTIPSNFSSLAKAIEILAEGLAIHAKRSEEQAAQAASEKKLLEEQVRTLEVTTADLKDIVDKHESEVLRLRNELQHEQSQAAVLRTELEDERSQLDHLRSKFAAGETGSEVLRERVSEEERKVASLSQKLVQVNAQAHTAEEGLKELHEQLKAMQEAEQRTRSLLQARGSRAQEVSRRLHSQAEKLGRMLQQLGFALVQQDDHYSVQRASKVTGTSEMGESLSASAVASLEPDPTPVAWVNDDDAEAEAAAFSAFLESLAQFDVDIFGDAIVKREKDIEGLARKWQKEARSYRDKYHRAQSEAHDKIAYRGFKEGDLALFLPTRNQSIRSWAAFNVGAPHYFLREQDVHKLSTREWLLARITRIEERVVDLSRSMNNGASQDRRSVASGDGASLDDENPFDLSDGLRWYLLDATEEKPGAPSTPGLGKSTVASARVDAKGTIRMKRSSVGGNVAKTLSKSLDSRRNSNASRKGAPGPTTPTTGLAPATAESATGDNVVQPAEADAASGQTPRDSAALFDEVRRDLLRRP